jgi:hypothetical protein
VSQARVLVAAGPLRRIGTFDAGPVRTQADVDAGPESEMLLLALALAVYRGLSEALITIPFPQHDLHLASVSSAVGVAPSRMGHNT